MRPHVTGLRIKCHVASAVAQTAGCSIADCPIGGSWAGQRPATQQTGRSALQW